MSGSDIDIALRITADLNDAKQGLSSVNSELNNVGTAADKASAALKKTADAQNSAATAAKKDASAQKEVSDAFKTTADTADKTGASVKEVAGKFSGGMWDEATKKIKEMTAGTGLLGDALSGLSGPLSAVALGLLGVYRYYSDISEQQDKFNKALAVSGNYAATTAGELEILAQKTGEANHNIQTARDVLESLAAQGKLTEKELAAVGEAATAMSALTGQSADESASAFARIGEDAAKTSKELNDQYHYLDLATYQRIKSLQDQGDAEAAVELASATYQQAAQQRLDELGQKVNWMQSLWKSAGNAAAEAWQSFSNYLKVGSGLASDAEKLAYMQQQQARRKSIFGDSLEGLYSDDNQQQAQLEKEMAAQKEQMRIAAEKQQAEDKAIEAARTLDQMDRQNATTTEKRAKAVQELNKQYKALAATASGRQQLENEGVTVDGDSFSGGSYDRRLNDVNQRFKDPKTPKPKSPKKTQAQRDAEKEFKDNERYVDSLQKQLDKQTKSAAAIRDNEIATRHLTDAQRKQADELNTALTAQENQAANLKLQISLWKETGDTASAAQAEIADKYKKVREEFEQSGNTEGIQKIDLLINVEKASAQLDEINRKIQQINQSRADSESQIQAKRDAGILTEYEAAQQVLDLHKQTVAEIEKVRPSIEQLTNAPGQIGENASRTLSQLDTQIVTLNNTAGQLGDTLKTRITGGLTQAINGMADGTLTLGGAVRQLGQSVAQALMQMASQNIAQGIVGGAASMFGGAGASAGGASAGGSGAGTWLQLASTVASFFADGGHVRGPGTETSDSIPAWLSHNEFVTRAAVVKQPGALSFLEDFNRYGMKALRDHSRIPRHSTGGLAGIPAALSPASLTSTPASVAEPKTPNVSVHNHQQFNLIDDPARLASTMTSPAGIDAITVVLSRNPGKFKQIIDGSN